MIGFRRQIIGATAFFCAAVAVDQLSKYFRPVVLLNDGLAFGLPVPQTTLFSLVIVATLVLVARNLSPITYNLAPSLILAGGISNLLDRLLWGGVRDVFRVETLYFNVADVYVVGGITLMLYCLVRRNPKIDTTE